MKLRTTHNSIRIRIRKSEIEELKAEGQVVERIRFPLGTLLRFALEIDEQAEGVTASLADTFLRVSIPNKEANTWINSNQVGIEKRIPVPEGEELHLLIEKDFPCLDRPEEDKSDTFWELAPESPEAC
ncbi:MAG: hypothetical protein HRU41_36965 [Saprospiraceae bacterium]|nr:hypothetical protein [Saprospiraceae bacterium]